MQTYHYSWLTAHPERDELWLRERLKDGFDVHHLDGDHENNDPTNLVLIDSADHMMLHNGSKRLSRVLNFPRLTPKPKSESKALALSDVREAKLETKARRREELAMMAAARRRRA